VKRADRLYQLMQRLRDGQLHTAEAMAQDLDVSVRTIYRDMETLASSGVPVEGARGYGYTIGAAITLPPLNLTEGEFQALHLALATLGAAELDQLSLDARSLANKIDAVLPEETGTTPPPFGFATDSFAEAARGFAHMPAIRAAIRARQKLRITTADSEQDIRPLHLEYWGRIWTCICWSETNREFLPLRVDRITSLAPLPGLFVDEPGKTLADYRGA
jgi:predicted DNA-binding transcriptional regulator YafY